MLGKKGCGKTHTAVVIAEGLIDAGVPAIVMAPHRSRTVIRGHRSTVPPDSSR